MSPVTARLLLVLTRAVERLLKFADYQQTALELEEAKLDFMAEQDL